MARVGGEQEPPEEDGERERDRGEKGWSRPRVSAVRRVQIVHPHPRFRPAFDAPAPIDKTCRRSITFRPMVSLRKIRAVDLVIFVGLLVNAVVIALILYYFVL